MRFFNHLVLVSLVILSSCATVGRPFKFQGPQDITKGVTGEKQIINKFGRPYRVGYDTGNIQWTYLHYKYSAFKNAEIKDLVITFGKDGKVSNYIYNSSTEEDKMRILINKR